MHAATAHSSGCAALVGFTHTTRAAVQAGVEDVHQTYEINDLPAHIRNIMIRRPVLAEIERKTGSTILVKGRFYPPGAPRTDDPPIHLRVSCGGHHTSKVRALCAVRAATSVTL